LMRDGSDKNETFKTFYETINLGFFKTITLTI